MDVVPETFVDAFGEISFKHGMIRIDLVSMSGTEPRVTQRLITSLQAFSQILQAQNGMFEQLEKAGVIRPVEPPSTAEPVSSGSGSWGPCAGWHASSRCRNPQLLPARERAAPRPAPELGPEIAEFQRRAVTKPK